MNPEDSPLLAQLQDIHSAGQPGWWPPAPGWWVLALIGLLVILFALRKLFAWLAVRRRRKAWLHVLEKLNRDHDPLQHPHEYLAGLNRLFRAIAVKAFPGTACARLQGEEWVAFITALMPERSAPGCLAALASGPYEPLPGVEAAKLNESARTWVSLYG
jgi:hypothetical protein